MVHNKRRWQQDDLYRLQWWQMEQQDGCFFIQNLSSVSRKYGLKYIWCFCSKIMSSLSWNFNSQCAAKHMHKNKTSDKTYTNIQPCLGHCYFYLCGNCNCWCDIFWFATKKTYPRKSLLWNDRTKSTHSTIVGFSEQSIRTDPIFNWSFWTSSWWAKNLLVVVCDCTLYFCIPL